MSAALAGLASLPSAPIPAIPAAARGPRSRQAGQKDRPFHVDQDAAHLLPPIARESAQEGSREGAHENYGEAEKTRHAGVMATKPSSRIRVRVQDVSD